MKNLHLLPTNNLSKLYKENGEFYFEEYPLETVNAGNQYIYITSDKEIKEGDWCIHLTTLNISKHHSKDNNLTQGWNKIILTTDPNLIKDGVQGIPDDFLEWFVKNPTCEEVEVDYVNCVNCIKLEGQELSPDCCHNYQYKIIIPKEKPKQETIIKYTAIEWLVEQLEGDDAIIARVIGLKKYNEIYKKAKEMERQQIIDFTDNYVDNCVIPNENMAIPTIMDVPQYYNETFKNK
jgi:hypothetical protein